MLVITKPNKVPHGGLWRYKDKESGASFAHPVIRVLQEQVYKHKLANGKNLDLTEFVQNVCQSTGGNICHDADNKQYNTLQMVSGFMEAMTDWAKSGLAMASQEILTKRIEVCHGCEHWKGSKGGSLMHGGCKLCGCRGIKLSLATTHCPAGKWA